MGRLTLVLTLLCLGVAAVYALAGDSSNQALQPMHEAVDVDVASDEADAEAALDAADSESDSAESESESAVDEVEAEWLSPADAAFLQTAEEETEEEEEEEAEAEGDALATSALEVEASKDDKQKDKKKKKKGGPAEPYVVPCDISAKRGICLFDGQKVIVPDATPKGLVGRYTFDDNHALDSSRFGNHGAKKITAAPGRGGAGFSAAFNGKNKLEIPHSKSLGALTEFTISFWLYVSEALDPKQPKDCPIMAKGTSDDQKLFSISVDASSRSLVFNSLGKGGKVSSRGRIGPHRWTHVTAVRSSNTLSLFLHGVLDNTEQSGGGVQEPPSPLYVGRVPWANKNCRVPFFIDDLRIYARPLSRPEIEAESFGSLGAIEPSFAHLGCLGCGYGDAVSSCRTNYHLCSQTELNAGGYQVARAMGWGDGQIQIWTNVGSSNAPPGARLAMCCGGL